VKLALAPMEGLIDEHMRTFLTRGGAFDHCVTEFLRISDQLLPSRVFHRICPESRNDWKTPSGTPVHLQLLGSDPELMAQNARRGALLGAPVIDVNFGCPSKTVNHNRGGSVLLQDPQEIYGILKAMREAIPAHIPLTAKMRLGYEDKSQAVDNALAMEAAGIDSLCIHARTKVEGYKPPAHWQWIAKIKEQVSVPITANGEIWTIEDYKKCQQVSECDDIMLGRGAVASPDLALQIKSLAAGKEITIGDWPTRLHDMLWMIQETIDCGNNKFAAGRIKQWLVYFQKSYPQAIEFFQQAKRIKTSLQMIDLLEQEISNQVSG